MVCLNWLQTNQTGFLPFRTSTSPTTLIPLLNQCIWLSSFSALIMIIIVIIIINSYITQNVPGNTLGVFWESGYLVLIITLCGNTVTLLF